MHNFFPPIDIIFKYFNFNVFCPSHLRLLPSNFEFSLTRKCSYCVLLFCISFYIFFAYWCFVSCLSFSLMYFHSCLYLIFIFYCLYMSWSFDSSYFLSRGPILKLILNLNRRKFVIIYFHAPFEIKRR